MKAILIRVGIDQSYGHWNAPCNPDSLDYVYVPIPQDRPNEKQYEKYYSNTSIPALQSFSNRNATSVKLPDHLHDKRMHLDPDFDHLTYGDTDNRGRRLLDFIEDDLVVFYSSLRSIHDDASLIYSLIGLYVIQSIDRVEDVPENKFDTNAHTRYLENTSSDIIVRAKSNLSGRFEKYIPIGEFRNRSYRVKEDILEEWGGLSVKDGWIQRSVAPPLFLEPEKFMSWLKQRSPSLVASNR